VAKWPDCPSCGNSVAPDKQTCSWCGASLTAASNPKPTTPVGQQRSASGPRRRRRSPFPRRVGILFSVIALVFVGWGIYANQDAQRLRCAEYRIAGSRPALWTVTCFLNGNL
jgi:uncharacterized membrane protein YvbJ